MITISLTDFVDFVVTAGEPKLTKVRQIKERKEYKHRFDHWREMREAIVSYHADGANDKKFFDAFVSTVVDEKRQKTYPLVAKNYQSFLGRKTIVSEATERTTWTYKDLNVIVNPELKLTIDGTCYLTKLYFKERKLTKRSVDIILVLMHHAIPTIKGKYTYALHDVKHNKLYTNEAPKDSLLPLLYGEATSFITIWESLP
jgi:hypothetical protein